MKKQKAILTSTFFIDSTERIHYYSQPRHYDLYFTSFYDASGLQKVMGTTAWRYKPGLQLRYAYLTWKTFKKVV